MALEPAPYLFDESDSSDAQAYLDRLIAASRALPPDSTPAHTTLNRAAVVGAGVMGRGIAYSMARTGIDVVLVDHTQSQLEAARADILRWDRRAGTSFGESVATSSQLASAETTDIVIEAVPEDLALKCEIFSALDIIAPRHAILASNTSTLDIDALAAATHRPQNVIGAHFLLPAQVTKLLEIIPGQSTAPQVTTTMRRLAQAMGKVAVIAGNCDGFIGNRLFDRWHQEAMYLLEEGGSPEQIDSALERWGMAIGPFRTLDLIDNRLLWRVRRRRALADSTLTQPLIGDRLCEAGFAGRVVGAGWYLYDAQTHERRPNPTINALAEQCAAAQSLVRRALSDEEIISRCVVAVIQEGMRIVTEGHSRCPSDIDLTFCLGYGFPKSKGGPLHLATRLDACALAKLSVLCQAVAGRGKSRQITVAELNDLDAALGAFVGAKSC
jgi:3-hydroxyacyl-CoA dehydrogenase